MPTTVNVHEAKTHLSRLLERVEAGEEIIIARSGQPCARLVPLADNPSARQPGRLRGQVSPAFFDPLPEAELLPGSPNNPCACCSTPMCSSGGGPMIRG